MENDDSVEYWLSILGDALPTFATMPTPGAPNELAAVEKVAAEMGTPLIPMQRFVTRVVTEKNPDGSYRYKVALITVPRQCGKSALISAIGVTRNLKTPDSDLFYMAQKGKDGREQIEKTYKAIRVSRFARLCHHRKSNDSAQIEYLNGSRFRFAVPSEDSLHGKTFPWFFWDELFAVDEDRGNKVLGAAGPAQMTRKDRQTILVSTKGTPRSTYLNAWLKRGRLSVTDPESDMAFFEWSLPDGADANDPENWKFHPGLQGGLITKAEIEENAKNLSKGEYERAMMNRQTKVVESVLDVTRWAQSYGNPVSVPQRRNVSIGWELAYDKSSAAIVAAWKEPDGKIAVKLIRTGSGVSWLPEALKQLALSNPLDVTADKYPMNQMVADQFAADNYGLMLRLLKVDEFKTASVGFKSMLEDGMLRQDGHPVLRDAIASATTRRMGEGWVFSHERCEPALLAAVSAVRAVTEQRVQEDAEILFAD